MPQVIFYAALALFIFFVLANFACQIYVSTQLYSGLSIVWGVLRGTRTFIHGWRQAKDLGMTDIMVLWSVTVVGLVMFVCGAFFLPFFVFMANMPSG